MRVLASWIGRADLEASRSAGTRPLGPVAAALLDTQYDAILLLSNFEEIENSGYLAWLRAETGYSATINKVELRSPMDFGEVFEAATAAIGAFTAKLENGHQLTFHLSPGTSAMATAWVLLAKTKFPATLIQSSLERGVEEAHVPFDISAELVRQADQRLASLPTAAHSEPVTFGQIVYRSEPMDRVIRRAQRVARRSVPILLEGESGTGKELIAHAIHDASLRRSAAFIAINCGAIPSELVESTLFGHRKGAFTGAAADRSGAFEAAHQGTLFLDEVGDLPLAAQVKLLRVLQEGEVTKIGDLRPRTVDVRVIAATNRRLADEIREGRFREDLYYRLAVAVLKIPPLREREGDLSLLIEHLLGQSNAELATDPGYEGKKLSPSARNLLLQHSWPGNVRELLNTLRRAAVWSEGEVLEAGDIADALLDVPSVPLDENVLARRLGDGFSLKNLTAEIAASYLRRGLAEAAGNKSEAARLLGFKSHQTLSNWLRKYGVEG